MSGWALQRLADSSVAISSSHGDVQQLVSTISAAVAAAMAFAAVITAVLFERAQRKARLADKLAQFYDRIITAPIMQHLQSLKQEVMELLEPATAEIKRLCEVDAAQTAVRSRVKLLIEEFGRAYEPLKDIVSTVIGSWDDTECNNALRQELEDLEDRLVEEMEKLAMNEQAPDPRKVLILGTARFYAIIVRHDPSLKGMKRPRKRATPTKKKARKSA